MSSNAMASIQKLKGRENYESWKFAVRAFLEIENLWGYIDGTSEETDDKKNKQNDIVAKAKLILLVEPINYAHIQDAKTAKEVWDKLKNAFDDSGLLRRVGLLKTLITTTLEGSSTIEEYVNQIITTAHKLKEAGMNIDDEWIGTLLLAGLGDEYKPMVMAIESSGIKISSDQIKSKLLQEVNSEKSAASSSAMLSKASSKKSNKSHKQVKCYGCNKMGHYKNKCPMLKSNGDKDSGKRNSTNGHAHGKELSLTCYVNNQCQKDEWILDSGASAHMTNNRQFIKTIIETSSDDITVANDSKLKVVSVGSGQLNLKCNNSSCVAEVSNVLYAPALCTNLLSVSAIVKKGYSVKFDSNGGQIFDCSNNLLAEAKLKDGMFKMTQDDRKVMLASNVTGKCELWHRRLGHIGHENLKKLKNNFVEGLLFDDEMAKLCEVCLKGKQTRKSFPASKSSTSEILELVHSDVCGPMEVKSIGESRYFVTFLDDFSRKICVYMLKRKSETLTKFKQFKTMAETQTGQKLKMLRTDNGKEYFNDAFSSYLKSEGVIHQSSAPYTPEQNGKAERMNRTLVEKARCMLIDAKLDKNFWAEAINTAAYIVNRSPCRVLDKTPEEVWSGKCPDLSHLRVFGCKAMMHIPKQKRRKFDPKSCQCIMLGYSEQSKAYRLFDVANKKTIISRDVEFFENQQCTKKAILSSDFDDGNFYSLLENTENRNQVEDIRTSNPNLNIRISDPALNVNADFDVSLTTDANVPVNVNGSPITTPNDDTIASESSYVSDDSYHEVLTHDDDVYEPPVSLNMENIDFRRSSRIADRENRNNFTSYVSTANQEYDPDTVEEALRSKNALSWKAAMDKEFDSLIDNKTWILVDLPSGRKPINCKWVFKTKCDANGDINQHKARLVVKGCAQRKGIDYEETFSPVVRYASIRYLVAMAAKFNLTIDQMDAVTAFLQGDLSDEIYMVQPNSFEDGSEKVCLLKKSLYGLKQASRIWNLKLDIFLKKFGLNRSNVDECIYYRVDGNNVLIVAIYVDDFIIFANDDVQKNELKKSLKKQFHMKDIGEAKFVLGMQIIRDRKAGTISINQSQYIRQIIERFGMVDCNAVKTPTDLNQKLTKEMCPKDEESRKLMESIPYQQAVGSLLFAAQLTRPDIQYAVNMVSTFNSCPGKAHWLAVKRIIRYLKGTIDYKLTYNNSENGELHGYCDADWASDLIERRSTTGYVFLLQGCAVTWNSKKQPTIALSSTEAEYMAMSSATQEALWLKSLTNEIFNNAKCLIINCDNKGALQLSEKSSYKPRTKHIDVRHHFLREKVAQGLIKFQYVKTDEMLADFLTKSVTTEKQQFCCRGMNLK